ncbi:MAG TPA: beta-galactosidase [Trebonia sp.]|nr:beta-galactosidase [Trebonia sp.]
MTGTHSPLLRTAAAVIPFAAELRVARPERRLSGQWQDMAVEPSDGAPLGISFRPLQAQELGLDPKAALSELLHYPFAVVRLAAYWDRIEPAPGKFDPSWLDWQVDAAERAGKQIIICTGPVKAFGYPEFFVPPHRLPAPLPEGQLITPETHRPLLEAGIEFLTRIVDRYARRSQVIAWQVEHEAVDPLGMEHSWRLSADFAAAEVAAARAADPSRPVLLNGFLPVTAPVAAAQWWRTRDQGDSLAVASRLADTVGIDYYPRHALATRGRRSVYLDGAASRLGPRRYRKLASRAAAYGQRMMITEIQAEPWEAVTVPPSPPGLGMYSCLPEQVIDSYNRCVRWSRRNPPGASAYLLWGAEYWLLRERQGDPAYLRAFGRILDSQLPGALPVAEQQAARDQEQRGQPGGDRGVEERAADDRHPVAGSARVIGRPGQVDGVAQRHDQRDRAQPGRGAPQWDHYPGQDVLGDDQELEDVHRRPLSGQHRHGGQSEPGARQAGGHAGQDEDGQLSPGQGHADGHREGEHAAGLGQRDQALASDLPGDQRRPGDGADEQHPGEVGLPVLDD